MKFFIKAVEAAKNGKLVITPDEPNIFDNKIYKLVLEFDNYIVNVDWNVNRWYAWGQKGSAINTDTNEKLSWYHGRPSAWTMLQLKPFISGEKYEGSFSQWKSNWNKVE